MIPEDTSKPAPTGSSESRSGPAYRAPSFYLLRQVFQPRELIILAVLFREIGILWKVSPGFVTSNEFLSAARYVTLIGISSVGASVVIISGGIDLSVGALYGLVGIVLAYLLAFYPSEGVDSGRANERDRHRREERRLCAGTVGGIRGNRCAPHLQRDRGSHGPIQQDDRIARRKNDRGTAPNTDHARRGNAVCCNVG